jgi:GTP-binding protein EngB required for normal cell division
VTTSAIDSDRTSVPARLAALAELTRLGTDRQDGFDKDLLKDAESLLRRSGERMRMSGQHTVVALAGGTGSGKSSLFNALAGATFSPPGVTRPTTRHAHACVWGMEGAAPLLDWLSVQRRHRYARASALDDGETILTGLLLLDLPDHDSVVSGSAAMVDRLVKMTDMLVWVLDPLKYADASVHQRYLMPLAGHASVTTVVLNQSDTLPPDQAADCEADLRRLLDAEGLPDTQVLMTSAATGAGLDELRAELGRVVAARNAANDRIAADIDLLLDRFEAYSGDQVPGTRHRELVTLAEPAAEQANAESNGYGQEPAKPPWEEAEDWTPWAEPETQPASASRPPWEDATPDGRVADRKDLAGYVPVGPATVLTAAFTRAAGVAAVTEALHGIRMRTANRYVGWPPALLAARLRGHLTRSPEQIPAPQAQRSDIDNAVTEFADELGGSLPEPWARTVRVAARSRAGEAQAALGTAVSRALPDRGKVTGWWRLVAIAQWLLMLLIVAGVAWICLITAYRISHTGTATASSLISNVSLLPWLALMVAALVLLGSLTSSWCQNMVLLAADKEQEQATQAIRASVAAVTRSLVLVPAGAELADYERFRTQLQAARARSAHG